MSSFSIFFSSMWVAMPDMPGRPPTSGGHVHARVADGGHLDVVVALGVDGVEAEEGEEEVGLDALGAGAVGHDQARGRRRRVIPWR